MADLGAIGLLVGAYIASAGWFDEDAYRCNLFEQRLNSQPHSGWNIGGAMFFGLVDYHRRRVVIDGLAGNPAPALIVTDSLHPFRLAVKAGSRTASADVLQPQASAIRPRLRVRANPAIGLTSDLEAVAGPATGWQTVSVSFTATANGGVRVELVNTDTAWPCWFDNVRVT